MIAVIENLMQPLWEWMVVFNAELATCATKLYYRLNMCAGQVAENYQVLADKLSEDE